MKRKINFYLFLVVVLGITQATFAQFNTIKIHHINNVNPQIIVPFKSNYNSFGGSYERCIGDHMSVEIMGLYARSLLFESPKETNYAKVFGFSTELKVKYYFQVSDEFLTYAPYGWYVASVVGYTSMKGTENIYNLNAVPPVQIDTKSHSLNYISAGALCGYQFILEEYEQGLVFDVALGFNYINTKGTGYGSKENTVLDNGTIEERHKMYNFIPKIQVGFGFAF